MSDQMPKATIPRDAKCLVGCTVRECRGHLRDTTLDFAATAAGTEPYRPIVLGNHREICSRFSRKFLSDQRSVKESVYPLGITKPDISFAIDPHCVSKRGNVIGLRTTRRRQIEGSVQALSGKAHQNGLIRGRDPKAVVVIEKSKVFFERGVDKRPTIGTLGGVRHRRGCGLGQHGSICVPNEIFDR
jgi:hypothetical protein